MISEPESTVALPIAAEPSAHGEPASRTGCPPRRHLLDLDPPALVAWCGERGLPAFRADQVFQWVYQRGAAGFEDMTNLPKPLRAELAAQFDVYASTIIRRAQSGDGTVKLLLQWPDGATSECVLIPTPTRRTACISAQVGCPVGCRFCASGLDGVQRNLTAGQIVEQVLRVRAEAQSMAAPVGAAEPPARREAHALNNVVFMGLGEPLANYDQVMSAVRAINAPWGPNIGARKITLSTVGLPKQIRRLAAEGLQVNLALSLHAPNDALRRELIPWAAKIAIGELADSCRYYFERTGREITLEYVLLGGVNDQPRHAEELARFARGIRCNVNLIRYNPVPGLPYERPAGEAAHDFERRLRARGVNTHLRTSRGLDIDAACGQLRRATAGDARPATVIADDAAADAVGD